MFSFIISPSLDDNEAFRAAYLHFREYQFHIHHPPFPFRKSYFHQ